MQNVNSIFRFIRYNKIIKSAAARKGGVLLNVLVACEESQEVCTAFRARGHKAFSCDLQECSGGHPEWHVQGDVVQILLPRESDDPTDGKGILFQTMDKTYHYIRGTWDLIIAFPPCTYLSNSGACRLYPRKGCLNIERYKQGMKAREFFMVFYNLPGNICERVCIENPIPSKVYNLPNKTQVIQPYEFGEPFSKKTYLWLKGLPKLQPTNILSDYMPFVNAGSKRGNGEPRKKVGCAHKAFIRSKTFPGIAKAMAEQWG